MAVPQLHQLYGVAILFRQIAYAPPTRVCRKHFSLKGCVLNEHPFDRLDGFLTPECIAHRALRGPTGHSD